MFIILLTFAGNNFSVSYSDAKSGNLIVKSNDSNKTFQGSGNASVSIVPGSSSPENGRFFVPNLLNVSTGTTVIWTNHDLRSYKSFEVEQLHTVTSGTLEAKKIGTEFNSGFLGAGKTFLHTFNSTGQFSYFCTIHPFMTGKVIVS